MGVFISLYTKRQVEILFHAWGISEKIPGKGKQVISSSPVTGEKTIEWTEHTSDTGKRLYKVTVNI